MNKELVSLRIDPALWEWLGRQANALKTSRTRLIEDSIKALMNTPDARVYTPKTRESVVYTDCVASKDPSVGKVSIGKSDWGKSGKLVPRR